MERTRERALDPRRALDLLRETSAGSAWEILTLEGIESVKYRPGRRLTVRYEVRARRQGEDARFRSLFGKLYGGHKGERIYGILQFLRDAAPQMLIFPEPVGYNRRRRFLLMDGLEGTPLPDLLQEPLATMHVEQVANGLAALHSLDPNRGEAAHVSHTPWRLHNALAEAEVLDKALAAVQGSGLPAPVKAEFHEICVSVQEGLAGDDPCTRCVIHRDFYPAQVLSSGGQLGLVDLDETCLGEAELDVGNFIAHLQLAELQEQGDLEKAGLMEEVFTSAYSAVRSLSRAHLALYQASSLLRLASLPRLGRPGVSILGWDRLAGALMHAARRALDET